MTKSSFYQMILLLICFSGTMQAFAGPGIPAICVLSGNKVAKDSFSIVEDAQFYDPAYSGKFTGPYYTKSVVSLRIKEDANLTLPANFVASIPIKITYTFADNHTENYDETMLVFVQPNTSNGVRYILSRTFHNVYRVKVTIGNFPYNSGVSPFVEVVNELFSFPTFRFDCDTNAVKQVSGSALAPNTNLDELLVDWPTSFAADEYDLEWTYIDSSALANGLFGNPSAPDPKLIFENNASRVSIRGTSYKIPLIYDNRGFLYYRVRAVQIPSDDQRLEANWSSQYSGGLGKFEYYGHERVLNWQSNTSFAEDGKRKTVLQYFDGSLRNRQTVTKDNSTNRTVVAESFYDYQGRPVINVLPAPTLDSIISYSQNFNRSINGDYDKSIYDTLASPAAFGTIGAPMMETTSGASKYYSSANPQINTGFNKYIPDAEKFPFTEVEYAQDNSGRIQRQSGVGKDFQLGTGHETKYYYGTPDQRELDALFGTEVGIASHYFKNMVRDANGQYSVSYVDMHGRTVATALAGVSDSSSAKIDTLSSYRSVNSTQTLSGLGSNVVKGLVMESKKSLLVSKEGNHTFKYSLNPQTLLLGGCDTTKVCYECLYDLRISITDDKNNQNLGGQAFDTIIRNFTIGNFDTSCATQSGFNYSFVKYLKVGNYEITKQLTVAKSGIDYYRDSIFMVNNRCKNIDSFIIQQQRLLSSVLDCTPSCQSCLASLGGNFEAFRANFMEKAKISVADSASYGTMAYLEYQKALEECNDLCGTVSEVNDIRKLMLLDVTPPSGQYARSDSSNAIYSIFYKGTDTINPATPNYRKPVKYYNADGSFNSVYDESAGQAVKPQDLSQNAFSEKFQLTWADSLLKYHPEFRKLVLYETLRSSHEWDRRVSNVETYTEARQKGLLNPIGETGTPFNIFGVPTGTNRDSIGIINASFQTALRDSLLNYRRVNGTTPVSMWGLASATTQCKGNRNNSACFGSYSATIRSFDTTFSCVADLDVAWRTFRQMYFDVKRNVINNWIKTNTTDPAIPTVTQLIASGHQPHFSDAAEQLAANNVVVSSDTAAARAQINASMGSYYQANCLAYAKGWVKQLSRCTFYSPSELDNVIIPQLVDVCRNGSDIEHPYGSSSISPDSTNTFSSFEAVIRSYNQAHNITDSFKCNAFQIKSPKAYDQQQSYNNKPIISKPNDCECTTIKKYHNEYKIAIGGYTSFSDFLFKKYQTKMPDSTLTTLLNFCNPLVQSCSYLPKAILLPPVFQCYTGSTCVNCVVFTALDDEFSTLYPAMTPVKEILATDSIKLKINALYTDYLNYRLGFDKAIDDYLNFKDSCSGNFAVTELDSCTEATVLKRFGGNGEDYQRDMQRTADGGYIIAGGTRSFGSGGLDGYVIKTNRKGDLVWSKTFGGASDDDFSRIKQTSDKGYVAIGTTRSFHQSAGEVFVVKMDSMGAVQWSRGLGAGTPGGERGYDIIQTSDGGYALTAHYDYRAGLADGEVVRLNSAGNLSWARRYGSNQGDTWRNIVEVDTVLIVTGEYVGAALGSPNTDYDGIMVHLDPNTGAVERVRSYDIDSRSSWLTNMIATDTGLKVTVFLTHGYGSTDVTHGILDLSLNGAVRGFKRFQKPVNDMVGANAVFPTLDGGDISVQGEFSFNPDMYFHKTNLAGVVQWSNAIRQPGTQYIHKLIQNPDGTYAASGETGLDIIFLSLNPSGQSFCADSAVNFQYEPSIITVNDRDLTVDFDVPITNINITVNTSSPTTTQTSICASNNCSVYTGPVLCGRPEPVFAALEIEEVNSCTDSTFFAVSKGTMLFQLYNDSLRYAFDSAYKARCLQAYQIEKFTITSAVSEYHHTLYYYDLAGNLIKTVPPEGVKPIYDSLTLDSVAVFRSQGKSKPPKHTLVTQYRFNTLNQVIAQTSPDGGRTDFWYDRLGRLALSRNAKQLSESSSAKRLYSYTRYDSLGRITEVGQIRDTANVSPISNSFTRNVTSFSNWFTALALYRGQVTKTIYDQEYVGFSGFNNRLVVQQKNLRNRVSYTSYTDSPVVSAAYNNATFYTYDIHGNVDSLLQDYGQSTVYPNIMNKNGNRFKKIVYKYDLISGKVNKVSYQEGWADQFYHKYSYDAENRLTLVETSSDNLIWTKDARYEYYHHGPLARTVIGDLKVQGMDYAYTLQGWLKGINSTGGSNTHDVGGDAIIGGNNQYVSQDAYALTLNYFGGDYKPVNSSTNPFPNHSAYLNASYRPLYNGNISSTSAYYQRFENFGVPGAPGPLTFYNYKYDQLNRLTRMDAYIGFNASTNSWSGMQGINAMKERVKYDGNGNIKNYVRYSITGSPMDSLTYTNYTGTNRLQRISDPYGSNSSFQDLGTQTGNNYKYDAIGNLTGDFVETISDIKWNVYGKIKEITKTNDGSQYLSRKTRYEYDAQGNRISSAFYIDEHWYYSWYVRDAQGNIMSTYSARSDDPNNHQNANLIQDERYIYGSSRLGSYTNSDVDWIDNSNNGPQDWTPKTLLGNERQKKQYELTNQLGNVVTTITDYRIGIPLAGNSAVTGQYKTDIVTAMEYYPFGMLSRGAQTDGFYYRFGFNGKENDNEIKGGFGTQQDYGMRIYDPRVGRFLSVDPLAKKYVSFSPYLYSADNPVSFIDKDGEGPGLPPLYALRIISRTNPVASTALFFSNNTSNKEMYKWAVGESKDPSAYFKLKGAFGEAVAYNTLFTDFSLNLVGLKIGIPNPNITFGRYNNGQQVDLQETVKVYNGFKYKGNFFSKNSAGVIFNNFDGSKGGVKEYGAEYGEKFTFTINYEVKTVSPKNDVLTNYLYFVKGLDQVKRSEKGKHTASVLITDKEAWMKVASDPVYGPQLEKAFNDKPLNVYIRLIDGLSNQAHKNLIEVKTKISRAKKNE